MKFIIKITKIDIKKSHDRLKITQNAILSYFIFLISSIFLSHSSVFHNDSIQFINKIINIIIVLYYFGLNFSKIAEMRFCLFNNFELGEVENSNNENIKDNIFLLEKKASPIKQISIILSLIGMIILFLFSFNFTSKIIFLLSIIPLMIIINKEIFSHKKKMLEFLNKKTFISINNNT